MTPARPALLRASTPKGLPAALAAACLLLAMACSKEPGATQEDTPPPPDPNARLTSGAENTVASANAAQLTQVVRKYAAEKQRAPKDIQEVVSAGYLDSLPSAPPGKRFAIDKNLQVYLADQ